MVYVVPEASTVFASLAGCCPEKAQRLLKKAAKVTGKALVTKNGGVLCPTPADFERLWEQAKTYVAKGVAS